MSTFRPLVAVAVVSLSALMGAACSKKGSTPESEVPTPVTTEPEVTAAADPEPAAEPMTPPVAEPPAPPPLTDAQIAKVLAAVDQGEIDQAKVAQKKSKNPKVKKYAQLMITEHQKAKQKGTKLVKKAKLTPEDSSAAAEVTGKATALLDSLKSADAASIDSLYIAGQAEQHQAVLDLVDKQLIPSATDEQLKSWLAEVKTMVTQHADHAKELQSSMVPSGDVSAAPSTP